VHESCSLLFFLSHLFPATLPNIWSLVSISFGSFLLVLAVDDGGIVEYCDKGDTKPSLPLSVE